MNEQRRDRRQQDRREPSVTRDALRAIPVGGQQTFELRDRSEVLSARSTKTQFEMISDRRFITWTDDKDGKVMITFRDITGTTER